MSRDRILGGIRTTLDADTREAARRQGTAEAPGASGRASAPGPVGPPAGELMQQFKDFQRTLGVDVIEVGRFIGDPGRHRRLSASAGACRCVCVAVPIRSLRRCRGTARHRSSVDSGAAQDGDTTGLSRAVAGVAETGTLGACAPAPPIRSRSASCPTRTSSCCAPITIVGSYEEACAMVLAENGGAMPRTLNLVTGASRTGDIGGRSSWARMARDGWRSSFSGTADGVAIGYGSSAGSSSTASHKMPSPWSGCGTDCRRGRSFLRNRPPPQQVRNT